MEILTGIILLTIAFLGGKSLDKKEPPRKSEVIQCQEACASGVLKSYKWCKCLTTPAWERDDG